MLGHLKVPINPNVMNIDITIGDTDRHKINLTHLFQLPEMIKNRVLPKFISTSLMSGFSKYQEPKIIALFILSFADLFGRSVIRSLDLGSEVAGIEL